MLNASQQEQTRDQAEEKRKEIEDLQERLIGVIHQGLFNLLEHAYLSGKSKHILALPSLLSNHPILGAPELFFSLSENLQYMPEEFHKAPTLSLLAEVRAALTVEKLYEKPIGLAEMVEAIHAHKKPHYGFAEAFYLVILQSMLETHRPFQGSIRQQGLLGQLLAEGVDRDGNIRSNHRSHRAGLGYTHFMKQLQEVYQQLETNLNRL